MRVTSIIFRAMVEFWMRPFSRKASLQGQNFASNDKPSDRLTVKLQCQRHIHVPDLISVSSIAGYSSPTG